MLDHLIFLIYIIIFTFSTVGYGFLFSKLINENYFKLNIGYQGLFGFFSLIILSGLSSFLFKHGYLHNFLIHLVGLIVFFYYINNVSKKDKKLFIYIFFLLLIFVYIYKNHDDFPYYHLSYALNLSENKFIIGIGNFGHGFRTFSSLFYFHSLLYLPYIKFYLFHIGPFLILLFFNFIVIKKILNYILEKKKITFILFFSIFSFTFVNVAFYRLSEHGTDRSPQILVFLIFIILFEILLSKKNHNKKILYFESLFILLMLTSSLKALYYIYLIFIPIIFVKTFLESKFYKSLNIKLLIPLFLSLILNLTINFLNTGCFLYPEQKTCLKTEWGIPFYEVKEMNTHYEWWSKSGGGPGYKHQMNKEEYIINFNWFENWKERHFFNKVSDTLFGVIFICILYFVIFKLLSIERTSEKKNNLGLVYFIVSLIILEWFLKHPAMRYGGYVLIAIPFFIYFSNKLSCYKFHFQKTKKIIYILILFVFIIFEFRNIIRLNKEIKFNNYNLLHSPFFKVIQVQSEILFENKNFKIYKTKKNNMCWSSKTPCSYRGELKAKKLLSLQMVYRDQE
tara:strand:- start:1440 stop:3134 length:1695 start_codon:yes stop_codon:yes gene_type:complete